MNQRKYLTREELRPGNWYLCHARNFEYGLWNGTVFEYVHTDCGFRFPDTEEHYDADPHYGTVQPMYRVDIREVPPQARLPMLDA